MPVSYNGWSASPDLASVGVVPFTAAGVPFPGGVRQGDVATVLRYVAEQFNARVERLEPALGCWGAAYRQNRNADNLSCHASGTAIDCNAERHPNGVPASRSFSPEQISEIRQILTEVDRVVRWGGDFTGTPDAMHFEIVGTPAQVGTVARRLKAQPTEGDEMTDAEMDRLIGAFRALLGNANSDTDADPTHDSLADIRRDLREIKKKLGI